MIKEQFHEKQLFLGNRCFYYFNVQELWYIMCELCRGVHMSVMWPCKHYLKTITQLRCDTDTAGLCAPMLILDL